MLWFKEHKSIWRVVFLVMLALAITGPWFFDRVHVPQPHTCSLPNVRLDDDFCGVPTSITWLLRVMPAQFVYLVDGLMKGTPRPYNYARAEWLMLLFSIFLILPFLSTLALLIWQKWNWLSMFHRILLGLAAGTGLLVGIPGFSASSWMLWGVWLYICLTISMLIIETNREVMSLRK
jgi:hypothetical protein